MDIVQRRTLQDVVKRLSELEARVKELEARCAALDKQRPQ
jgi:BMFP domain-containing protein YqiC